MCRPIFMLSSTVMPLNSAMFWKVRAMPQRGRAGAACSAVMSWPSKRMRPRAGRVDAADAVEDAGLAGPVGADDGEEVVRVDLEADAGEGGDAAELEVYRVEAQQRHAEPPTAARWMGGGQSPAPVSSTHARPERLSRDPEQGIDSPEGRTVRKTREWGATYSDAATLSIALTRCPLPLLARRRRGGGGAGTGVRGRGARRRDFSSSGVMRRISSVMRAASKG